MKFTNEKGRSTLEMLCVLAIMGILSVIALNGYQYMMAKYKANKEVALVSQMISVIQQAYISQESYEGLSNNTLNSLAVLPTDFDTTKLSKMFSPYGGYFSVFSSDPENMNRADAVKDNAYTTAVIEVRNIPQQTCIFLATTNWGVSLKDGLLGVAVANTSNSSNISGRTGSTVGDTSMTYTAAGKLVDEAYANTTDSNKLKSMTGKALAIANPPRGKQTYRLPMQPNLAAEGCSCIDSETGLDTEECSFAIKFY